MNKISLAIVDDHHMFREELAHQLVKKGFAVRLQAEHGADLLEQLNATRNLPDVCITDVQVPVMDGFETVRRLKKDFPSIKVIGMSSMPDKWMEQDMIISGADAFLPKHSSIRDYMQVIVNVVQKVSV